MLKLEVAVTHMQKNFRDIEFILPERFDSDSFLNKKPFEPFDSLIVEYLNGLSDLLSKDPMVRFFPDVATFGFFCRKANILSLKKQFYSEHRIRLGRGIVFHIAPSNVPVNFAYTLVCGMLAGNTNIVRLPSKHFEQVGTICNSMKVLERDDKFREISSRIALVRYERGSMTTGVLSSMCDVRIIWGGDETIAQVRRHQLPPRSFDITFADRYSICAINADKYIHEQNPGKIAMAFYNDTYLFDQNACTAPHLIIWLGDEKNIASAKKIFWSRLYDIVKEKYTVQSIVAVDKLTSVYSQAAQLEGIRKESSADNLLWRVTLPSLPVNIENFRCTSGYFSEYDAKNLTDISHIIDRKYQTLSYYGFSRQELADFIYSVKPVGIDRIVPIGRTTDFSLVWDGYNLIDSLSRVIDILG